MTAAPTCDGCDFTGPGVAMSLANLAREARQEGRTHTGPDYAHEYRCKDKAACLERVLAHGAGR